MGFDTKILRISMKIPRLDTVKGIQTLIDESMMHDHSHSKLIWWRYCFLFPLHSTSSVPGGAPKICLSIYLSIYLSICLSICMYIYIYNILNWGAPPWNMNHHVLPISSADISPWHVSPLDVGLDGSDVIFTISTVVFDLTEAAGFSVSNGTGSCPISGRHHGWNWHELTMEPWNNHLWYNQVHQCRNKNIPGGSLTQG